MAKDSKARAEKTIDLSKMAAIIKKNFVVMTRDRMRIMPLVLFPVFMILIFGYTTGNLPRHIATAVVDYDQTPLSGVVGKEIGASDIFSIRHTVGSEGEARRLLDQGKVKVIVIIPAKFQEDIEKGEVTAVYVVVDESDASVGQAAHQTVQAIVDQTSKELAQDKLVTFQRSVAESTAALAAAASTRDAAAGKTTATASSASTALDETGQIITAARGSLERSLPPSIPIIRLPDTQDHVVYGADTATLIQPAAADTTKRFMTTLDIISVKLAIIERDLAEAKRAAAVAEAAAKARDAAHEKAVAQPLKRVHVFTSSSPRALITPIVYDEKPAYGTGRRPIDFLIPSIIALVIFQGAIMNMGRAIAGEKREGSLTRVFLTPTSNVTIILGTLLFYVIFESVRSVFIILLAVLFFHIQIEGSVLLIFLIIVIYAGVCTAIGMFISTLVHTEQQYMGMALLVSMPATFLAGVFFPIQAMPKVLQGAAVILPVTYAGEGLRGVMIKGFILANILIPLLVLFLFLAIMMGILFIAFKREID